MKNRTKVLIGLAVLLGIPAAIAVNVVHDLGGDRKRAGIQAVEDVRKQREEVCRSYHQRWSGIKSRVGPLAASSYAKEVNQELPVNMFDDTLCDVETGEMVSPRMLLRRHER